MAESYLHKKIKDKSVEYLMNKGYLVARSEVGDHYYGIIDAWGVRPRDLYTMGVEVKVSRSDWKAAKRKDRVYEEVRITPRIDNWTSMNEMYYACPSGLIHPNEVSESVGLLWYDEEKGRFFNKKKPYFLKILNTTKIKTLLSIYNPFFRPY